MREPKECGWCDQILNNNDDICSCCGNVVDGSKLDRELDELEYQKIQKELDKYLESRLN